MAMAIKFLDSKMLQLCDKALKERLCPKGPSKVAIISLQSSELKALLEAPKGEGKLILTHRLHQLNTGIIALREESSMKISVIVILQAVVSYSNFVALEQAEGSKSHLMSPKMKEKFLNNRRTTSPGALYVHTLRIHQVKEIELPNWLKGRGKCQRLRYINAKVQMTSNRFA